VNGRRAGTLVLAASLGLNLALAGVLIYNEFLRPPRFPSSMSGRGPGSETWSRDSRRDSGGDFPRLEREQIEKLRAMREAMEEETRPLWMQVRGNQALIQKELLGKQPNLARLDSLWVANARLQESIQLRTLRLILEEREVLTREQYEFVLRWMVPASFGRMETPFQGGRNRRDPDRPESRPTGRENPPPPNGRPQPD